MKPRRALVALQRLAAFLRRDRHDPEFDEELEAHIEMAAQDYQRRGMSPDEARRAAFVALGGRQAARDLHLDTRTLPWLDAFAQDVRYAFRNMRRATGFTVTAILILALGIGANTLVFSVVNAMLLRPLPFAEPERLVWITNAYDGSEAAGLSGRTSRVATMEEWQRRAQSFEAITSYSAFFAYDSFKLQDAGEPERVGGAQVARELFDVLGVPMHAGRGFTAEEALAGGPPAMILTHALWQRRFNGDPAIIGRTVTLNDARTTIVGVLPSEFDFGAVFSPGVRVDLFQPLVLSQARNWGNTLAVIGRLRPGVTIDAGRAEMASLMPRILADNPDWGTGHGAALTPLQDHVSGSIRPALLALAAAVGMVLLIVCANLSNLMLSRGAARQRELSIRAALGAGRGRLVRQLLTETMVLASAGAAAGLALAFAGARLLSSAQGLSLPMLSAVTVDMQAAAFTAAIAFAAAVAAGLAPALQQSHADVQHGLKDATRGTTSGHHARLRAALVVAEVSLACVLLVGAGLLLRSFDRVMSVDLGFEPEQALAITVEPPRTMTEVAERKQFAAHVLQQVSALPGVTAAGLTDSLPLDRDRAWGVRIPGRVFSDRDAPVAHVRMVSAGYFEAMGIPLRAGRGFTEAEAFEGAEVIVINERMARSIWPGRDAVGEQVIVGRTPLRVIAVARDVRHAALETPAALEMYLPIGRSAVYSSDIIVRASGAEADLLTRLRGTLRAIDPTLPVTDIRPLTSLVDRAVSPRRFYTGLLSAFAAVAIALACIGIFGVISYGVSQRTQEIGIRLALGASASQVRRRIVTEALGLTALGVAIGVAAAYFLSRGLSSMLFGVSATDPATFVATAALLLAVAGAAGYLPARRASRVDPLTALRQQT